MNIILVSFMVLRVHLCNAVGESSIGRKADIPSVKNANSSFFIAKRPFNIQHSTFNIRPSADLP